MAMKYTIATISLLCIVVHTAAARGNSVPGIGAPNELPMKFAGRPKTIRTVYLLHGVHAADSKREVVSSYDGNGDLISSVIYKDGCVSRTEKWSYAKPGLWSEKIVLDGSNKLRSRTAIEHDSEDRVVSKQEFDSTGSVRESVVYTYDKQSDNSVLRTSKILSAIDPAYSQKEYYVHAAYNPDGSVKYQESGWTKNFPLRTVFTYNDKGETIRATSNTCETTYEYDEHGNVVKEESNGVGCQGRRTMTYSYNYDREGNVLSQNVNGAPETSFHRVIEYY